MNRIVVITGVFMIILAIIFGAFGAHALKIRLGQAELQSFEVGVRYQMYHGLALLFIGLNSRRLSISLRAFNTLVILGTILFSGSIYFLSLDEIIGTKLSFLGPVTPIGGLLLIVGWSSLLINVLRTKDENQSRS